MNFYMFLQRNSKSHLKVFWGTRKNGRWKKNPRKNGPRENNVLQKLFSVKRMLENLNDFIFIDWFYYTHEKMFKVYLTILHAPNCRTLK